MKKVVLACLVAGAMSAISASAATVKFSDGMGTTGGGEFKADVSDNGFGSTDYVTFCLEYRENLEMGKVYQYEVSQAAMYNGNGTVDPISRATAWLYSQFVKGTLAGINAAGNVLSGLYSNSNSEDPNQLQKAIWYLEGESQGANNAYAQLAVAQAGMADNNGFYNVGVMNVWEIDSRGRKIARQDQLISLPSRNVPDGGTSLVLLGMAMTGLAAANRRFRKS